MTQTDRDHRTVLARAFGATPQGTTTKQAARGVADLIERDGNVSRALQAMANATGLSVEQIETRWMQDERFYD